MRGADRSWKGSLEDYADLEEEETSSVAGGGQPARAQSFALKRSGSLQRLGSGSGDTFVRSTSTLGRWRHEVKWAGFEKGANTRVLLRDMAAALGGDAARGGGRLELEVARLEEGLGGACSVISSSLGETFVGSVVVNIPEGVGYLEYPPGDSKGKLHYSGQMDEGHKHGLGVLEFVDGTRYMGEFRQGLCRGYGVEVFGDGSVFSGQFSDDTRNGHGVYAFKDGRTFGGGWKGGVPHGAGIESRRRRSGNMAEFRVVYEEGVLVESAPMTGGDRPLEVDMDEVLGCADRRAEEAEAVRARVAGVDAVARLLSLGGGGGWGGALRRYKEWQAAPEPLKVIQGGPLPASVG